MLVLFSLLSFLPPASALVYIKIASLKYNTYLGKDYGNNLVVVSQDSTSANTTWLLSGPYISTLDGLSFLGVTNDAPILSKDLKEEWTYDRNTMMIGMESRSGYLMMDFTAVSLEQNPDTYNKMIMYPVPQSKGKKISVTMKERLSLADEEQHNLTKAMKGQYAVTDKFLARIEAFKLEVDGNLTAAKALTDQVNAMTSRILGDVATLISRQNTTIVWAKRELNATRAVDLPDLERRWADLQYVPDALLDNAKHKKEELLAHIDKATAEFNTSVTDLMDKHRVLPQGSYDWIVITVIVCYVIYFVDVFLRVSKPRIGKPKTNLTMEMEQQDLETPGISPEHFLADSLPRTFDSKAVKIQGELKFHPR